MGLVDITKRRVVVVLGSVGICVLLANLSLLSGDDVRSRFKNISIPIPGLAIGSSAQTSDPYVPEMPKLPSWDEDNGIFEDHARVDDHHPIVTLMQDADKAWANYEEGISTTFSETVRKYRRRYGRHPPPGFKEWYKFARERNVHNIDDFSQVMDDLRPFWAVEPSIIRSLAAHMHEEEGHGISGLHIRDKKVWKVSNPNWRVETLEKMVEPFVKFLPDMDIAMNRLDQPRIVVPWDDMQSLLDIEAGKRQIYPDAAGTWTKDMEGFFNGSDESSNITNPEFFTAHGAQYMILAKEACPPESPARSNLSLPSDNFYKDPHGFVTNFNRSSDLCTVGPEIEDKHGFLFAPSTIVASRELLPIFGECKVNVNSDILFPANMYYRDDDRYAYDPTYDYDWPDKKDSMIWRGVTSGGTNTADNWQQMHRQRLVLLSNGTVMAGKEVRILSEDPGRKGEYYDYRFDPSEFALEHTDVGFTDTFACWPNCDFYDGVWTLKAMTTLSEQFKSKFLVDVDGHSFSGRWHAFLQSKSLGIKSTIFREWHDSRLFAWRHFVPMDNRYDDLYKLLTYFIGLGSPIRSEGVPYVPRHDFEGRKLGRQGREWAEKVLRREDIEIYTFRLLLEYARIIDDNRDRIGYSKDGSELDKYDAAHSLSRSHES